jgi:hypothetical protein
MVYVTYQATGRRGGGTGVVTEEATTPVTFDEQGRAAFGIGEGVRRRIDPIALIEIDDGSQGWL